MDTTDPKCFECGHYKTFHLSNKFPGGGCRTCEYYYHNDSKRQYHDFVGNLEYLEQKAQEHEQ